MKYSILFWYSNIITLSAGTGREVDPPQSCLGIIDMFGRSLAYIRCFLVADSWHIFIASLLLTLGIYSLLPCYWFLAYICCFLVTDSWHMFVVSLLLTLGITRIKYLIQLIVLRLPLAYPTSSNIHIIVILLTLLSFFICSTCKITDVYCFMSTYIH